MSGTGSNLETTTELIIKMVLESMTYKNKEDRQREKNEHMETMYDNIFERLERIET